MEKQVSLKELSTQNALLEKIVVPKSDLQKKEEAYERQKQRMREYYWKNRDKIRARQRELYAAQDKAKHAARIRKYRQDNKEKTDALRKEYRAKNREKFRAYDEKYRQKYREKLLESKRAYWHANRDVLLAKKREYYAKKKGEKREHYEKVKRKPYEENRYRKCSYTLNCYCLKSIEQISYSHPDEVNDYMKLYPFEEYAELFIRKVLSKYGVYSSHGMYDDCYEAGMLAYLYSIHRCAAMQYTNTQAYIKKMVRIYIICAIVVYNDVKNICRTNGMREIRLDAENSAYRY